MENSEDYLKKVMGSIASKRAAKSSGASAKSLLVNKKSATPAARQAMPNRMGASMGRQNLAKKDK